MPNFVLRSLVSYILYLILNIKVGGELMDFIIVLHGQEAVNTFSSRMHFSLGAGLSVAAGPVGRVLEADMRAGNRGSGVCYTYSCSKGNGYDSNFQSTRIM
jgi:lipid-binding SYLF domain-containing protein